MFQNGGGLNTESHQNSLLPIPRAHEREVEFALSIFNSGHGSLVWVGEPGMGKSSLLRSAQEKISGTGARVIQIPRKSSLPPDDDSATLTLVFDQLLAIREVIESNVESPDLQPLDELADPVAAPRISQLARELAKHITLSARVVPLTFIIDDLEDIDDVTRRVLIGAVAQRNAPATLLLTASDWDLIRSLPYEVERRALGPVTNEDALCLLRKTLNIAIAPHVVRVLNEHVYGAPRALVEIARTLSTAQLTGGSQLPDPLPATPTTERAISHYLVGTSDDDRNILLTCAIAINQRTDLLLAAIGDDIDGLLTSAAARFLRFNSGETTISDSRVRSVVYSNATIAERTAVHQKLAQVHAEFGSEITAIWHESQATLTGDSTLAKKLLEISDRMLALGAAEWAQRVAREALAHATGKLRPRAMIAVGRAALNMGHISDAVGLLREAVRILPQTQVHRVSAALTAAVAFATGQVPDEVVPGAKDHQRAQQMTAIFHSVRGRRTAAATAVAKLEEEAQGNERERVQLLRAWLQMLGGDFQTGLDFADLEFSDPLAKVGARVVRTLALVGTGNIDEAHGVISAAISELSPAVSFPWDPQLHTEPLHSRSITPVLESYLHLADIQVEYASGNLAGAQQSLEHSVYSLPMALPAAGLVSVIAGRLSVLRTGKTSGIAETLEELLPLPLAPLIRSELLANRALAHLMAGEVPEAETLLNMTRRANFSTLTLIARPNHVDISELLTRPDDISTTEIFAPDNITNHAAETHSFKRVGFKQEGIASGLDHALNHLLAGRRLLENKTERTAVETNQAIDHLLRAAMFFDELGAPAAASLARNWVQNEAPKQFHTHASRGFGVAAASSGRHTVQNTARVMAGAASAHPTNPVDPANPANLTSATGAESHADSALPGWAAALTRREREVAQIIANGASNREAAATLYVSVRTIEVHLTSIFRKLEIGSRVELAIVVNRTLTS